MFPPTFKKTPVFAMLISILHISLSTAAFLKMPRTDMAALGNIYLPVTDFSSKIFDEARQTLTSQIDKALAAGDSEYGPLFNNTAFSASVFSLKTGKSIFEYHYEAPTLGKGSYTKGKLTEDTIYRTGSLGKLLLIYTWLVNLGESAYLDPITKYIPEFEEAQKSYKNPIMSTNWSEVTVGALASQLSGIGRDYALGDLSTQSFGAPPPEAAIDSGYPPLPNGGLPCDAYGDDLPSCSRAQFLQGIIDHPPVNHPYYTPSYSNLAYAILGLAYEKASGGMRWDTAADKLYNHELGMLATTAHAPAAGADAVIPYNDSYSLFTFDIGIEGPAGNQYTSTKDLRTWGQAIWTNKLLDPVTTRRWMKPKTFTSRWTSAVGDPWEIYRLGLPVDALTDAYRVVDTYSKGGDVGQYSTAFSLVPDYEIGWSVMAAGEAPGTQKGPIRQMLVDVFYNAMETAMKEQARATFPGIYSCHEINSSVTLTVDGNSGVEVKSWISNSTDMFNNLWLAGHKDFRLYPTSLSYQDGDMTYHKYYLATLFGKHGLQLPSYDPWSDLGEYWIQLDGTMYNNLATDSWIIGFDADGMVQSVESQAVRAVMYRSSE
ncbi:uncharacterized protein LTR77_003752 [Saxophila tyrrhenica]|uniref:Beta-lactamase-related domain-containing protein n=1 Tax=Saxophila tyrrhenica TaxID=1690608 RepID=A0AAV9PF82_9PEZI|nr:hypothetical protein LTR77_003752 [Saxophila tyrrhenica]